MFYEMCNFRDRIRNSEVSNFIFCNISMLLIFGNYTVFTCTNFVSSGNVTYLLVYFSASIADFFLFQPVVILSVEQLCIIVRPLSDSL